MKIGLLSLGCPKNLVDSEVMLGLAEQAGHEVTASASDADVLVVNTCAFVDSAKQESIAAILEMAGHKQAGTCSRLVVTGCLAERYRDELQRLIPEIDVLLGTGEVPDVVRALGVPPGAMAPVGVAAPLPLYRGRREVPTYLYDADTPRHLSTPPHYAYVKVAEGCDYACAFCIIPTLRGPYRSRPHDSIVREAEQLAARGVKELLLVSQDTSFYGVDRRERGALARLLRRLDRVDGLAWIRLLYLYPTTVTDDVLEAMAECEKVCRYVDLPLQHSAGSVLGRMRRPGDRAGYERLLQRIRDRVPGVALRTTLIVGFPGETEDEFADLRSFVAAAGFDHLGVFAYSHEEGTAAHALADDVPAATKRRRRADLMRAQRRHVERRHREWLGQQVRLLLDGPSREHHFVWQGRLETQAPEIDPVVYLTDCDPAALEAGRIIDAEIVGARGYELVARPVAGTW